MTINSQMWGPTPQSYIKTVTVTRTRSSGTVKFYSEAVETFTDAEKVTAAMRFESALYFLERYEGVASVSVRVEGNTEITDVVVDTLETDIRTVLKKFESDYPDVVTAINTWNEDNSIVTVMTIS